ncbi:MAG TPA: carboxypeptidase regulatory-like domain-containing protein [Bryobacteraceae bacterium]|nr:carboxypeptidase regulatory-like domain-containing protein [Bryobacteraceae bacterium]
MRSMRFVCLFVILAALVVPVSIWAQGAVGTINGTVTDATGGAVAGATVTATNTGTRAESKTRTDATGAYRFVDLPPGQYTITVEAPGFRKSVTAEQRLLVASTLRLDVSLEVGQVTESVTVDTRAAQVNTDDAQLGEALTNIPDLPILSGSGGRNALSLVALQPGVVVTPSTTAAQPGSSVGPFNINGQRSQANNFILDGADSNDLAINIPDSVDVISPNALGEFRVVTGPMKAEYGRNSGAVIETTIKSGTNSFHGQATEIFRNKVLNATPFFLNAASQPKPQYNANDFDANIGGRVIKDRTFFFVSYLGFRRVIGQTNEGTVFSDAERAAILASGVPAAKAVVNITPKASFGNQLFSAPVDSLNRDQGVMRIDHRFSNSNNFSASYFTERSTDNAPFAFQGPTIPGFGELDLITYHNVALHDTHTFGPNIVNEAVASFHRRDQPGVVPANTTSPASLGFTGIIPDDPSAAGPPFFNIGSIVIGNTYQGPQARRDNTWQYQDSVSWIKGRHTIKFGAEFRAYEQNQIFDFINNGYLAFSGDATTQGLVPLIPGLANSDPAINDFANGYISNFYDQSNANRQGYRDKFFSVFAQDDFRVTRTFTLNIGLRYDFAEPLTELNNRVSTFRPGQQSSLFPTAPTGLVFPGDQGISNSTYSPDKTNFGPRVGFAWDPLGTGKLSIRSGFGIFYNVPESELSLQFLGAVPYGAQVVAIGSTDFTHPYQTSVSPLATNPFPFQVAKPGDKVDFTQYAPISLTIMDPKFRTPMAMQYSFQVQYQIARDWVADAAFVGSQGRHLEDRRNIDPALLTPNANRGNEDARRVFNQNNPLDAAFGGAVFGTITDQLSDSTSSYNSLQLSLRKQFSYGLQMTNAYTWAHCIDTGSGLRTNSNPFNALLDRGNCDTDVRHSYVGSALYELPFFKQQRGFLGHVLGGFKASTVVTLQSGIPFDITDPSGDRSLTGSGDDRPDYVGGTVQFVDPRSNQFGNTNSYFNGIGGGSSTAAANPFFHRVGSGASVAQGAGRYGTLGRNVFHGPGTLNTDVAFWKAVNVTEHQSLIIRMDAFNFFNHTQFFNPNSAIDSPTFGTVTLAHDPRLIQLTLRYQF